MSDGNPSGYLPGDPRYGLQGEALKDFYRTKPAQWAIYCWDRPGTAATRRALLAEQKSYIENSGTTSRLPGMADMSAMRGLSGGCLETEGQVVVELHETTGTFPGLTRYLTFIGGTINYGHHLRSGET